jgi:hypothetical protein
MSFRVPFLRCFMLVALGAAAQSAPMQSADNSQSRSGDSTPSPAASVGPLAIRGCINGGNAGYTLTQKGTGATFALQGSAEQFEALRRHPVEITAREFPPSTESAALPKLVVSKAQTVKGECPWVSGGNAGTPNIASPATVAGAGNHSHGDTESNPNTPEYGSRGDNRQAPPAAGNNPNVGGDNGAPSPGTGNPLPPKP